MAGAMEHRVAQRGIAATKEENLTTDKHPPSPRLRWASKMDTNKISGGTACPLWRSLRAIWDRVWKSQRRSYGFRGFHGWEINLEIRKSGKESEQAERTEYWILNSLPLACLASFARDGLPFIHP
jgi:hypothetical protein